ncbi:MAG: protein-L-isoaspartate(D-aspartate) O-methyltransferase [Candidatus Omnitrophota bacterium]
MERLQQLRADMVTNQLKQRGVKDERLLNAMGQIPREEFVHPDLIEFAYEDSPLPIEEDQTISQPYIVALMAEALEIKEKDKVLDVGTGSGYAAAIFSKMGAEVWTIERHKPLAETARGRFKRLGYDNVHVLHGDGTQGWPEKAPFDAINVAAGGERVPDPLLHQLKIGGRLIIPVMEDGRYQKLFLIIRRGEEDYERQDLGAVRFVPLISGQPSKGSSSIEREEETASGLPLQERIVRSCEDFDTVDQADPGPLMDRIGSSRIVLMGEASHGTAEFYEMRARVTRRLVQEKGFNIIAVEADWPDAANVNRYIHGPDIEEPEEKSFQRFPTWMWRNTSFLEFVEWMKAYNEDQLMTAPTVNFYGLDLYSLYSSIDAVLRYLDKVDPETAGVARRRYACLMPWESDPGSYGAMVLSGKYKKCEDEVVRMLKDLKEKQAEYASQDGQSLMSALHNAKLVAEAEKYYRVMYYGSRESWNLRDTHMFHTLNDLLDYHGADAKAVVWAHNSHIGNASATEMGARKEINIGQLCREKYGDDVYSIGFGTHRGTVAAASNWDGPLEVKEVRPAQNRSYEVLFQQAGLPGFFLPLRHMRDHRLYKELSRPRLQRAIGVIYRPETELASHYFEAELPRQFDEYIWIEKTRAVQPVGPQEAERLPETFPFGV